jgi:hypothetical protein
MICTIQNIQWSQQKASDTLRKINKVQFMFNFKLSKDISVFG